MSDFVKLAKIIASCKTKEQWTIAEKVIDQYDSETLRKFKNRKVSLDETFSLCDAGVTLRNFLSDRLVDIIGAPQRWKIGEQS